MANNESRLDCGLAELTASIGDDRAGRRGVPVSKAAVPENVLALAIALAACMLGGAEGVDVEVCPAPTSAGAEAAPVMTSWMIRFMMMIWMMSLIGTAWCAWKARGIWDRWNSKGTADKSTQSQTTYRWWWAHPKFMPLAAESHGSWTNWSEPDSRSHNDLR